MDSWARSYPGKSKSALLAILEIKLNVLNRIDRQYRQKHHDAGNNNVVILETWSQIEKQIQILWSKSFPTEEVNFWGSVGVDGVCLCKLKSLPPPPSPPFAGCFAGMCSSRGICGDNGRPNRSPSSRSSGSGAHYALCALGVGVIALGIVMIVWTVIPGGDSGASPKPSGNSTGPNNNGGGNNSGATKTPTVAMVLVGVGALMLILAIGLGLKSKKRAQDRRSEPVTTGVPFMTPIPEEPQP